jgi:UPF0716 protein FxsA
VAQSLSVDFRMRLFALFLLVLLVLPLAEIWLFIEVGSIIGAGWTVLLIVATAFIGALLIRVQGLGTLARVQTQLQKGELPAIELLEGVLILLAGGLLLIPGFITDVAGFALLLPLLRRAIIEACLRRGLIRPGAPPSREGPAGRTLEGEYRHLDD